MPEANVYLHKNLKMPVSENLKKLLSEIPGNVKLIAVSKTKSNEQIMEAYSAGQRAFGENMVQELVKKQDALPKDIEWHLIGHLQTNKVKYIAPFVSLIHSVDSLKLLIEINKRAFQNNRIIDCLLQIYIAREDTKFGFSFEGAELLLNSQELKNLKNVRISGLMGMASNMEDGKWKMEEGENIVRKEFNSLHKFFIQHRQNFNFTILSMGMSSDYTFAIEEGSNMIRVGSIIFGGR